MSPVNTPILTIVPGNDIAARGVAGEIVATLREEALETELHELGARPSLDRYGAVVIGASLDAGARQVLPRQFLMHHRARLISLPVAAFAVARDGLAPPDAIDDRHVLLEELARYRWLHPIAADVFRVPVPDAHVVAGNGTRPGFTLPPGIDLEPVRSWARLVARLLTPVAAR